MIIAQTGHVCQTFPLLRCTLCVCMARGHAPESCQSQPLNSQKSTTTTTTVQTQKSVFVFARITSSFFRPISFHEDPPWAILAFFLRFFFLPNDFNFINATSSIDGMILRAEVCFPIFFYSFSRKAPRKSLDLLWRFFLVLPLVTRRLFSREILESKTQLI